MARLNPDSSVLGPSTRITGRLSGDGAVRVEGNLKGDLTITGPAEIAESGSVEGNVKAETLEVLGSLLGDVITPGPIAIRSSAVVRGELRGSEISIEPGARVSVRLETELELDVGATRRR